MQLGFKQHELDFIREAASFLEAPSALLRVTQCMGKRVGHLQNHAPHAPSGLFSRSKSRLHKEIFKEASAAPCSCASNQSIGTYPSVRSRR